MKICLKNYENLGVFRDLAYLKKSVMAITRVRILKPYWIICNSRLLESVHILRNHIFGISPPPPQYSKRANFPI